MGRRERKLKSSSSSPLIEDESKEYDAAAAISSDEDAEANEDLSLKIVEKAMQRANSVKIDDAFKESMSVESKKSRKDKKKKRKKDEDEEDQNASAQELTVPGEMLKSSENFCSNIIGEDKVKEDENEKTSNTIEIVNKTAETDPVEISDNAVLRKLLRGPRYFDPPDSSWGRCYNCGEEGHMTANCTSAKRKKPCFVCGSLEHNVRQCTKGKDCFICKREGHRAKDCPEKYNGGSQSSKICLKCGDSGHEMFSCRNDYHPDDLKGIQCYVCKSFGHLCCADYPDNGPSEVSCYRCGSLGHTGLACTGSYGETSGVGSLNTCYRCGEDGHFARECTIPKGKKRSRELSTPKKKVSKVKKEHKESWSMPSDFVKTRRNKAKYEGDYTSGYKTKRRGGWIMDDPEDYSEPKGFASPVTPSSKRSWKYNGNASSPWSSSRKSHKLNYSHSSSSASAKGIHHRFSASRFGNSSHGGTRNHDW
ncbi:PREDICTED: zinc finger CCHC domain-containing protein 7 isoform X2 [Ipomoea nil]|uniref:zinc finger CCHC domain-containing protein 7 isoform X2 n=1 Tax=Ipomoea nil TaxID=35883 RepID=UPI0009019B5C|nr:PREDICTED: zinc finger CCHC domain-containing protein 7 isoform X2 [Ipomoea nil]